LERILPAGLATFGVSHVVVDGYFNSRDSVLVIDDDIVRLRARLDFADTLEDVRIKYVNKLRQLMNINGKLHAPPIVRFTWDTQIFRGVMESCNVTYLMFTPEGIPLRAKVAVTLKEYRPVEIQLKDPPRSSPDVEKQYVVRRGDTLSNIAAGVYRDSGVWRAIASANRIRDPRTLEPGRVLMLPRLR